MITGDEVSASSEGGLKIDPGKSGKRIATIQKLHKTFDIWFDFFQTVHDAKRFRSVFRLTTTKENAGGLGDRIPAIHTAKKKWGNNLHFSYGFKTNLGYKVQQPRKVGHWLRFNIRQKLTDGQYLFEIFVDGKLISQEENKEPQEYHDVAVFIGDDFTVPVNGRFDNFIIASPAQDAIFGKFLLYVSTARGNTTVY